MSRLLFTCLTFILANTVIAQAATLENNGTSVQLQRGNWSAIYIGTTQLDGVDLIAALEKSEQEFSIPNHMAARIQTLVPLSPVKRASFRLSLVAKNQANLRVSFPLQSRSVVMNGQPIVGYFSETRPGDQFEFAVIPRTDGTLSVQYRRAADENASGEFALSPLPQLF